MKKENAKSEDKLLSVKELSARSNLSPSILYSVLHYEKLNYETIGGRILVKESVYSDWEKRNVKPKGKEARATDKKEDNK